MEDSSVKTLFCLETKGPPSWSCGIEFSCPTGADTPTDGHCPTLSEQSFFIYEQIDTDFFNLIYFPSRLSSERILNSKQRHSPAYCSECSSVEIKSEYENVNIKRQNPCHKRLTHPWKWIIISFHAASVCMFDDIRKLDSHFHGDLCRQRRREGNALWWKQAASA